MHGEQINVNTNDVYITQHKCDSDADDNYTNNEGTNYTIDFISGTKIFGTGPSYYIPDECYDDVLGWEPLGE